VFNAIGISTMRIMGDTPRETVNSPIYSHILDDISINNSPLEL